MAWLVAYDIADVKRLVRVAKCLEPRAMRVQYSVYVGLWTEAEAKAAVAAIAAQIQARKDDVRAYGLPSDCQVWALGRHPIPDGITLENAGFAYLSHPDGLGLAGGAGVRSASSEPFGAPSLE